MAAAVERDGPGATGNRLTQEQVIAIICRGLRGEGPPTPQETIDIAATAVLALGPTGPSRKWTFARSDPLEAWPNED